MIRRFVLSASLVVASAAAAAPATVTTYTRVQHRAVFDLVGGKTDLHAICGDGQTPIAISYRRTAADLAAGIFSGWWYSPVHVRVTCAAR